MLLPIGKRLLIQPDEVASNQKIILTNKRPTRFKITAAGEEVTKVLPGDIVYLDKYAGMEIEYDGQKFMVIEEANILAKVGQTSSID